MAPLLRVLLASLCLLLTGISLARSSPSGGPPETTFVIQWNTSLYLPPFNEIVPLGPNAELLFLVAAGQTEVEQATVLVFDASGPAITPLGSLNFTKDCQLGNLIPLNNNTVIATCTELRNHTTWTAFFQISYTPSSGITVRKPLRFLGDYDYYLTNPHTNEAYFAVMTMVQRRFYTALWAVNLSTLKPRMLLAAWQPFPGAAALTPDGSELWLSEFDFLYRFNTTTWTIIDSPAFTNLTWAVPYETGGQLFGLVGELREPTRFAYSMVLELIHVSTSKVVANTSASSVWMNCGPCTGRFAIWKPTGGNSTVYAFSTYADKGAGISAVSVPSLAPLLAAQLDTVIWSPATPLAAAGPYLFTVVCGVDYTNSTIVRWTMA